MRRFLGLLGVVFAVMLSGVGCDEESASVEPIPLDENSDLAVYYNGLTVGNVWNYARGDRTYKVTALDTIPEEYGTGTMLEGAVALYEEWYGGSLVFHSFLTSGDSLLIATAGSRKLLHRFNPELLGDTIAVVGWFSSLAPVPLHDVLLDNEYTAVVPAGTFENCLLIESTEVTSNDSTVYAIHESAYAPGVGLVRRERTYSLNPTPVPAVTELISYTQAQPDSSTGQ